MGRPDHHFHVRDDGRGISYGPAARRAETWILGFATAGGERVELELDEAAMYELWTEVHDVPWPGEPREDGKLRREIVARIERADAETMHEVLRLLDDIQGSEP